MSLPKAKVILTGTRVLLILALIVPAWIALAIPAGAGTSNLIIDCDPAANNQSLATASIDQDAQVVVEVYGAAGAQTVDGVDVYINFDKTKLRIDHIAPNTTQYAATSLSLLSTDGPDAGTAEDATGLANANASGNADVSLLYNGAKPTATWRIATMTFTGIAGASPTSLTYNVPPEEVVVRVNKIAILGGNDLNLPTSTGADITVIPGIAFEFYSAYTAAPGTPLTSPIGAGTAQNLTIRVTEAGVTKENYLGTVAFTSATDPLISAGSGLPENYLFTALDAGIHTFTSGLTFKTSGPQTVTCKDFDTPAITNTSAAVTVNAGTATKVRVETAADGSGTVVPSQNLAAGSTLPVYSITRDANNNFVANAAATWSFASKTGGVVNGDLVAAGDSKSAVMTGNLVGTGVIHAVSGILATTDSGTITVLASAATRVRVETAADGSGTVVAAQNLTSGSTLTVYSITRDAGGNFVANAAAIWSFASKTGGVADGDLVAAGDGKSAVMTGNVAGTGVINAVVGILTSTDSGTITVIAGTATKVRVETAADGSGAVVPPQNLNSGSTLTVYSITRDASNNFVANAAATWSFTSTTVGVVNGDLVAAAGGKSAVMTGHVIGTGVIHAVSGTLATTDSGTITVIAGTATKVIVETLANGTGVVVATQTLASGSALTVYSITRDASNNFVANAAATWSFTTKTAGVVDGDLVAAGDGKSAVMTGHAAGTGVIHAVVGILTSTDSGTITIVTVNVTLAAGANYFSTPFSLESGYRTWAELAALQPDLANAAKVTAKYYYDPTNTAAPWQEVLGTYTVTPCDAIYVKVATGVTVNVGLVSNSAFSMPSKNLYAGWNLIGLGYYNVNLAGSTMDVDDALLSIYKGTGAGDTWGYSQVISPPASNQSAVNTPPDFIYLRDATTGVGIVTMPKLVATDGYFVFMVNNGKLGGFTGTPLP